MYNKTHGINTIVNILDQSKSEFDSHRYYTIVKIRGNPQRFEVDSGAGYTLLPKYQFEKLNLNVRLQASSIAFRCYTNDVFVPEGKATVEVQYKDRASLEDLYMVPNRLQPLLGRICIRHLGINLDEIDNNFREEHRVIQTINTIEESIHQFPEVFDEHVSRISNVKISLQLRENVKPSFTREREVPYALRERVDKKLDSLEETIIITKTATSDWGSSLMCIPKADDGVRLCLS